MDDTIYLNYKNKKGDIEPCIKAFLKDHPLMLGIMIGYVSREGVEALIKLFNQTAVTFYHPTRLKKIKH